MDDLFTAGITYDKAGTSESIFNSMVTNTKDKLVYVRTWAKEKTDEQKEKYGSMPGYFQNQKILSSNKITEENSQPQVAF
jgi:hypothetical protein